MVDIQTFSTAIASAGVLVAAVYYALQVRQQTRIRKTDLVTRLATTWGSREHSEASFRALLLEFKYYDDFEEVWQHTFFKPGCNRMPNYQLIL